MGGPHANRKDIEIRDQQIVNEGIAINYKKRSRLRNVGKESNMQVEIQTKYVHNSLDVEFTYEQDVNDGMVIKFKWWNDTCKAIK